MRKEATVVEPAWIESLRWRLSLVERRQWMRIFGTTLAAAVLLCVAWWWMFARFRPPPSIFDTPVDDTLGYLAMKDFSKLPLEERIRFMTEFAERFRGMQPGESAAAASFLAGLGQKARDQLRDNVRGMMKDALAEGASGYMALPPGQRDKYIDEWILRWQRLTERAVTGKDSKKSDDERLSDMRREGERAEKRRERFAGSGTMSDRGVTGFLDLWQGEVEPSSNPREQGQITRFLDDVRTRMVTR